MHNVDKAAKEAVAKLGITSDKLKKLAEIAVATGIANERERVLKILCKDARSDFQKRFNASPAWFTHQLLLAYAIYTGEEIPEETGFRERLEDFEKVYAQELLDSSN